MRPVMRVCGVHTLQGPADPVLDTVVSLLKKSVPIACAGLVPYQAAKFAAYLGAALTPPPSRRTIFVRYLSAADGVRAVADWRLLGTCLFLNGIAVRAEDRGQGHGTRMLEDGEDLARRLGCDMLALDVSLSNMPARRLYKRFGFVEQSYSEWVDVPSGRPDDDPGVRLLDWPAYAAHQSAYGFADLCIAWGVQQATIRVIGSAVRVPDHAADVATALAGAVSTERVFTIRPASAGDTSERAFAAFARMARQLVNRVPAQPSGALLLPANPTTTAIVATNAGRLPVDRTEPGVHSH